MKDLISVIVPVYGVENVLCRCMDSLLAQDYEPFEIIAVDDCSPDSCGKILDTYAEKDARVRVIHREKNGGLSAARNTGIAAAKGEYFAFADSDDYVEKDFLSSMYRLARESGAEMVSCGAINEIGEKKIPNCLTEPLFLTPKEALERMCYNDHFFVTAWDKLYARRLFDGVRYPEGKLFEDTAVTFLLVDRAEKIAAAPGVGYHYVTKPGSITTSAFHKGKLDYVEAAEKMASFIEEKYPDLKRAADRKRLHALFSTLSSLAQLEKESEEEKKIRKEIVKKCRALSGGVFRDKKAPRRDKFAILALAFGYPVYRAFWRFYAERKGTK